MTKFYRFGKVVCNFVCLVLFRIEVHGMEHLPKTGGFILASNHVSDFDPLFVGIKLQRQLNFMAKIELFKNRFFGLILRHLGAFPVSRGSGDTSAIEKSVQTVKNGDVLAIFPEGTRSRDGEIKRFKSGAIVVAAHTGADIVPTSIYLPKGLRFRGKVIVRYGEVIPNTRLAVDTSNPHSIKAACSLLKNAVCDLREDSK